MAAGVAAVGVEVSDIGVVTTPELHFTVQTFNQYHALEEQAYFTTLLESFR
jgi:phosphomannomutase